MILFTLIGIVATLYLLIGFCWGLYEYMFKPPGLKISGWHGVLVTTLLWGVILIP